MLISSSFNDGLAKRGKGKKGRRIDFLYFKNEVLSVEPSLNDWLQPKAVDL